MDAPAWVVQETVWLGDDSLRPSRFFSGHIEVGPHQDERIAVVEIDEALAWARERSNVVRARVQVDGVNREFDAGSEWPDEWEALPKWDERFTPAPDLFADNVMLGLTAPAEELPPPDAPVGADEAAALVSPSLPGWQAELFGFADDWIQGPAGVPLEEALAWARGWAEIVVLERFEDDELVAYSAGTVDPAWDAKPFPGAPETPLPRWPSA